MSPHAMIHPARWTRSLGALVLGTALLLTAAACDGVTLEQVQGVLQNVDSISGEETVQIKDVSTNIDDLSQFDLPGETVQIKDLSTNIDDLSQFDLPTVSGVLGAASLEAGDEVTLDVDQDGHAHKVASHHAEVKGTLTAVDAAAGTVTIERDGSTQTLTVSPTARIEVRENEHAALTDLTIGVQVEAKVNPLTGEVLELDVYD